MNELGLAPEQASTFAGPIDTLYFTLTALTLLFAVPIPLVILFFTVRYHHTRKVFRQNPTHTDNRLEMTWIGVLLALSLGVFFWSALLYFDIYRAAPTQGMDIYIVGRQWMWFTQHPQGKRENNELHVPVNTPVRLIMTSQDVIHSFFVPAFRTKMDVLPGRYTIMWFEATKTGEYHLFCTEYCGTEHSYMRGRVVVMEPADYQRWLREDYAIIPQTAGEPTSGDPSRPAQDEQQLNTLAAAGQQLFESQGCINCHVGGRGERGIAPSLVGIFGSQEELEGGTTVTVDENYLRESILNPQAQIVAGYQPIMPQYEGVLNEEQLIELIEYIKSLSSEEGTP
jgi:cytochrome c oxidase subunit II